MRRILAGIVSGAVGLTVYLYSVQYVFGLSEASLFVAGTVTLGTYGVIDWLGVLPAPFEQDVRSILHRDERFTTLRSDD